MGLAFGVVRPYSLIYRNRIFLYHFATDNTKRVRLIPLSLESGYVPTTSQIQLTVVTTMLCVDLAPSIGNEDFDSPGNIVKRAELSTTSDLCNNHKQGLKFVIHSEVTCTGVGTGEGLLSVYIATGEVCTKRAKRPPMHRRPQRSVLTQLTKHYSPTCQ